MNCIQCQDPLTASQNYKGNKFCSNECSGNFRRRPVIANMADDNPEVYYWAGFLFGDGCVDESGKLQVCLSDKDVQHMRCLSMFLFGVDYTNVYPGRCHLQVTDTSLCHELRRFGIVPNKTYLSTFTIPREVYARDFVRGYFDADGWYSTGKYPNKRNGQLYAKQVVGLCSYLEKNMLLVNGLMPTPGSILKKKSQELYELRWTSRAAVQTVRDFLFGTPCLGRKWTDYLVSRSIEKDCRRSKAIDSFSTKLSC